MKASQLFRQAGLAQTLVELHSTPQPARDSPDAVEDQEYTPRWINPPPDVVNSPPDEYISGVDEPHVETTQSLSLEVEPKTWRARDEPHTAYIRRMTERTEPAINITYSTPAAVPEPSAVYDHPDMDGFQYLDDPNPPEYMETTSF
jgi:hypothetical protein